MIYAITDDSTPRKMNQFMISPFNNSIFSKVLKMKIDGDKNIVPIISLHPVIAIALNPFSDAFFENVNDDPQIVTAIKISKFPCICPKFPSKPITIEIPIIPKITDIIFLVLNFSLRNNTANK